MDKDYSRISPTAVFCARMRAKHGVPFAKEILDLVDSKYKNKIEDLPDYEKSLTVKNDFIPFIEGRYYSLSSVLENIQNIFIVELATGLSPRSLAFLNKKDVSYLETDLPKIVEIKKQIIQDVLNSKKINALNLFFMPLNPLKREDMDNLGKLFLKKGSGKQLIVIHEGFLMYLNKKEKKKFIQNIKYLFENYDKRGILLSPDFSRIKKSDEIKKGSENIRDKISKVTNREFDYFESEEDAKNFLNNEGFKYNLLSNQPIIKHLIEKKRLTFNAKEILDSSIGYKVWEISLKD